MKNRTLGSANTREWTDLAELGLKIRPGRIFVNRKGELLNKRTGKAPRTYEDKGYVRYQWEFKGKKYSAMVHRIVAMAYLDGMSRQRKFIDHLDTKRNNNNVENLRWVTAQENAQNPITMQRTRANLQKYAGRVSAYFFDGTLFRTFNSLEEAACALDLPKLTLQKTAIRNEKIKHCYGLLWKNTPMKTCPKKLERKDYELGKNEPAFMTITNKKTGQVYISSSYTKVANRIGSSAVAVKDCLKSGHACNGYDLSPISCKKYWEYRSPEMFQ